MALSWILCGFSWFIVLLLMIKIYLLKKGMNEICMELSEHLSNDTNQLIVLSTRDKNVSKIAMELNKQLRLLRNQRRQYYNGNQELKNAVTNIAHDLRTPLTAICGYLELLDQEEKSTSVERYINIIKNRTEFLTHLTEELFCYSVVRGYEHTEIKNNVIVNDVLEESIAEFYVVLKEHNIDPIIQITDKKVKRFIDPSALSRVFSNLLSNAIKYSDGDLDITLLDNGEVTFTNTASSINEIDVGKLFDRYYTVETAKNSTGLGLSISRLLIEQLNGTISAKYENNKLTICIMLPKDDSLQV